MEFTWAYVRVPIKKVEITPSHCLTRAAPSPILFILYVYWWISYYSFSSLPQQADDAAHLVGDAYLLRALREACLAVNASVGTLLDGYCWCVGLGESSLTLGIGGSRCLGQWQLTAVHRLVVEGEVTGDIHTIGARHAVGAGGTRDGGIARSMNHRLWEAHTWLLSGAQ